MHLCSACVCRVYNFWHKITCTFSHAPRRIRNCAFGCVCWSLLCSVALINAHNFCSFSRSCEETFRSGFPPGLDVGVGGRGCVFGVFVNVIVSLYCSLRSAGYYAGWLALVLGFLGRNGGSGGPSRVVLARIMKTITRLYRCVCGLYVWGMHSRDAGRTCGAPAHSYLWAARRCDADLMKYLSGFMCRLTGAGYTQHTWKQKAKLILYENGAVTFC